MLVAFLACVVGYVITNIMIDGFLQAPFANWFLRMIQALFDLDYYRAQTVYQVLFRNNKAVWLMTGFILLLLVFFYFGLTRFTRYFNEISQGIDKLTEESEGDIALSPELEFMEKKLNTVKRTLEKRKNDALESEQRKNDLVVYLAHDIKTPLTSVIGYLSLLDEAPDMPLAQRAKYVNITLDKAYRLEQLINEFFEITRFNLQTIVLDKEEINLSYMLLQMADEFYPLLSPHGKKALVEVEDKLSVHGDPVKLARVFNNILKNALAYSFDHSTIEIHAHQQGEQVVITFTNQGKTIPAQKLSAIFEKFYRLDTSRSSHTGGAGLGLAIAKEIVLAHEGSITAESKESVTKFTVTLPLHA